MKNQKITKVVPCQTFLNTIMFHKGTLDQLKLGNETFVKDEKRNIFKDKNFIGLVRNIITPKLTD